MTGIRPRAHAALLLVLAGTASTHAARADGIAPSRSERAILMLSVDDPERQYMQQLTTGFREALAEADHPHTAFIEYFDQLRFEPDRSYQEHFLQWIERKYVGRRLDALVLTGADMVALWAGQRERSPLGQLPAVYASIGSLPPIEGLPPALSGVVLENPLPLAFEVIRTILPGTRRIAFVSGGSASERARDDLLLERLRGAGLDVLPIRGQTTAQVLEQVARLPPDTAVYLMSFMVDGEGRSFSARQVCEAVSAAANRPLFSIGTGCFGHGIVGGPIADFTPLGRAIARHVVAMLEGQSLESQTLSVAAYAPLEFDARQLVRWGIPESRLPAGSPVRFRPPSLWRDHRTTVLAAAAVGIGEALLIVAIVLERQRGARTQQALASNYRRLHEMGARVVMAEEKERTRIARDLHDDLGQRLASMAIGLSSLRRRLPDSSDVLQDEVTGLQREALRLSNDLRQVSHELHPGMLEQFGLVEALRLHVDELQAQTGMDVTLDAAPDGPDLPDAVTLCLYRVAQEATRNAVKHSSARCLALSLEYHATNVTLSVRDDGRGFDPAARRSGLGLTSQDERLRMLGGSLEVRSSPGAGTTIVATLPKAPLTSSEHLRTDQTYHS